MALNINSVIIKDLKVYIRHRKTLLLIFLAPVIIMILIGSIFSGASDESLKEVKLGVGGSSELGNTIIDELKKSEMFIIIKVNTSEPYIIEEGVKAGKYNAGIFIPENQTEAIKLYIDNSRLQIAPVISGVFLTITEKMSYELTLRFITKLWNNLEDMESELDPLKENILLMNKSISELNTNTKSVLYSLDEVDVANLNNSVTKMKNAVELANIDFNQTLKNINSTRQEIKILNTNINTISNDAEQLNTELKGVVGSIDSTDKALLDIQKSIQNTYNALCTDTSTQQCKSLSESIGEIQNTRSLIQDRGKNIKSLQENLDNIANTGKLMSETLRNTDAGLEVMENGVNTYNREMESIRGNVKNMENAVNTLDNVKKQSSNISSQIEKLNSDIINKTPSIVSDIDKTKNALSEIIKRSPSSVAAPVKIEKEFVFKERSYLDFLMPGVIAIVLMFISFLLASITIVQERTKKTLIRTLLTPLSLEEFIFAKTAALILISVMQGIILIIVAFVFYGVVVPFSQWGQLFIVILCYAASFIGIGMALATFAESENTAMLSSLVLGIPMLFLSGIFFPFETMPQIMAIIGNMLPITLGIRAFDSVLIYRGDFDTLLIYLIPLVIYGVIGIGIAYILLKKEVMD